MHGSGGLSFSKASGSSRSLWIPCGQCMECRKTYANQIAVRCVHEAKMHDVSSFITLTYRPECLESPSLIYRDFQMFCRRVRERVRPFRFYMCGEYGETTRRPHFHACIFGIGFEDRYPWRMSSAGFQLYRSDLLESLWTSGSAEVGELSIQSARYVAGYVSKKITGDRAEDHYISLNPLTGECWPLVPEFSRSSNRPGIGATWFQKYGEAQYVRDGVVIDGKVVKMPRYYDKLMERINPKKLGRVKRARLVAARAFKADQTPDRLRVREECSRQKVNRFKRDME